MAPLGDATMPGTRRQRKSIGGHVSSSKAVDKENATVDLGSTIAASRKKSRSKSIGPGGLDVLKNGSGNRRASLAAPPRPPPRSILKPTIAPLPEIPPLKKRGSTPRDNTLDQDGSSKIALRTEEEQQAAAKEREERERREARRKSLANRRVSFAAEATLHTFQIEYLPDSTTSTDSTRRASSNGRNSVSHQDDDVVPESPEHSEPQRRRRRSSTIGHLGFQDDNTVASSIYSSDSEAADGVEEIEEDENSASSSDSDSDADDGTMVTVEDHEVTGASVMSAMSGMSGRSMTGSGDNDTLDQELRAATERAGAHRQNDFSDSDEEVIPSFGWIKKSNPQSIACRDQENIQPANATTSFNDDGMDMEMTGAVGGIIQRQAAEEEEEEQEMTMEVTHALGGILPPGYRTGTTPSAESGDTVQMDETMELTKAIGGIHKTTAEQSDFEDENEDMSMEFTAAIGSLLPSHAKQGGVRRRTITSNNAMEDATMDMDMTVGVGRILPGETRSRDDEEEATMGMDMTVGVGRILSSGQQANEADDENQTMGMEMTAAIGGILNAAASSESRVAGKRQLEEEVNQPDTPSKSPLTVSKTPSQELASAVKHLTVAPQQSSPIVDPFKGRGLRHSMPRQQSVTPQSSPFQRTPSPPQQVVQASARAASPAKSASPGKPTVRVTRLSPVKRPRGSSPIKASSPVRTPQSQRKTAAGRSRLPDSRPPRSPSKSASKTPELFQNDPETGARTPTVTLTPQTRRHSGVGADKPGLGSPRVSEIFSRRASLGETALEFVPGKAKAISFVDPRVIEAEVDKDRRDEDDKENGRKVMEREADGQDGTESTLTLKEMIASMSPKRNPLRGRKSLHVGSASGLLGKRPLELDDDEEAEDTDGVKRLKGHQGSPVKNIKLQQPPSKAETTGRRLTRSGSRDISESEVDRATPTTTASPLKGAATPKDHARFRDVPDDTATNLMDFDRSPVKDESSLDSENPEERIHLQDFLNMTSIRFMELTTTKRRHTQAPETFKNGLLEGEDNFSLERCVIAGACTVPMLELYQHSCRELKKYISEGRRIVREIESETFEENPPLFREYISATPDFKSVLDNQFKNGKTHARLESKAMWYQWRMALQEGLKEGLVKIGEGMDSDEKVLKQQEKLLSSVVPALDSRFNALDEERSNLDTIAQELADCDPAELNHVRLELNETENDIEEKTREIVELRKQLEMAEVGVEDISQRKQRCQDDIKEAEKIREECRGWSTSEISSLQARVDAIENKHGWAITGISDSSVSMTYRRDIELVFDISTFAQRGQKNSQIDLWYIAANRDTDARPSTVEKEFFVQCIRDHIRALPQSRTKVSELLHMVRAAWDLAISTCDDVRRLNITFPTTVARTSDSSIAVAASLLLAPIQTKVEVVLGLHGSSTPHGVEFAVHPEAKVVYGEQFNVSKMAGFLSTHLGSKLGGVDDGKKSWNEVVVGFHERLLAKGSK